MYQYLDLLRKVREQGQLVENDRTGVGTLSLFAEKLVFDLQAGFPAVTTKKLWFKGIIGELLWFLQGSTNIKWLKEQGITIWDEWADENGELGPVYGYQWRSWPTPDGSVDQIAGVIESLQYSPASRRHLVSAWNVGQLKQMALQPCHLFFQFYVRKTATGTYLDLQGYQRSVDMLLGLPFNIASYAALNMMIAQICGYKPGIFTHILGDTHIYLNHLEFVDIQLGRKPYPLPNLWIDPTIRGIDDFTLESFELRDYIAHPNFKNVPIAV
ncbi:MAG: thymidylate synthase [Patescibacteria group bacterium]